MRITFSTAVVFTLNIALMTSASIPSCPQTGGGAGLERKLGARVERSVQASIQPYFPKAKTQIDHKNNMLIVLTCAKNIGPTMLQQIQPEIEKQFYTSSLLKQIALTMSGIKRVGVGFEDQILVFDLTTHRDVWISGERIPEYTQGYGTICN